MSENPQNLQTLNRTQATSRELFAVMFRRKWLILGLFFVVTATVITLAFTTPVSYVSSGRVLVMRGERLSALTPGRQLYNDWEEDLGSEVEVAKSYPVIQRAREMLAEEIKKTGKQAKLDAGSIDIEVMGKSNVLGIGYSDLDADKAQMVCNALLNAYVEYRAGQARMGKPEAFFETELQQIKGDIERLTGERRSAAQTSGVNDPEGQSRSWTDQLGVLDQRYNETSGEFAEATSSLRAMRELQQHPDIDLPTLGAPFTNESALVGLKQKILDQQGRIAQLREKYRDDAPEVQNATATLETLQGLLHKEVNARLMMSQSRIDMLQSRLAVYEHDRKELRAKLDAMPASQTRLSELDAQVRLLRERYDELAKARDQARITANTSTDFNVVLLNPAGAPAPKNTRDYVRLALAPAFSIVVGIGLAFFIDGLDLTVRTSNQAEEYLELPVLATISDRRTKRG